jgi:hypothetical protein
VLTDDDGRYDLDPASGRGCVIPGVRFFPPGSTSYVAQLDLPYDHPDLTAAPDVQLLDAHLVASPASDGSTELAWTVPAELADAHFAAFAALDGREGDGAVWGVFADAPHATLPARGLEDYAVRAGVTASRQLEGGFALWVTDPTTVPIDVGSVVSLARGASCTVGDAHGDTPAVGYGSSFENVCPLTDRGFSFSADYGCASPCEHIEHATVDLGAETLVRSVAIHDLEISSTAQPTFDIQLSTDGTTFTTVNRVSVPPGEADFYDVIDVTPTSARFVRIALTTPDGYIFRLAELGVF